MKDQKLIVLTALVKSLVKKPREALNLSGEINNMKNNTMWSGQDSNLQVWYPLPRDAILQLRHLTCKNPLTSGGKFASLTDWLPYRKITISSQEWQDSNLYYHLLNP